MNTKIMIAATVAALSLATTAFAGEGGRNDLAQFTSPQAQLATNGVQRDTGDQQYPAPNPAYSFSESSIPSVFENGQNRPVQTANSLPRGFENGTPEYMEAQSLNRWYAQQAGRSYARAQAASRPQG